MTEKKDGWYDRQIAFEKDMAETARKHGQLTIAARFENQAKKWADMKGKFQ